MSDLIRLRQRVYLHAFPKAGLHLAEMFVRQAAAPIQVTKDDGEPHDVRWFSNIKSGWTTEFCNLDRYGDMMDWLPAGGYIMGHCAYTQDIAKTLWDNSICSIFVYRNLRDVAVSTAHHVLDTRVEKDGTDRLLHPDKAKFQALDTFEDVLYHCIVGLDEYPGVIERWRMYEPWLTEGWVLSVSYEELRLRPRETASRILRYVGGQTAAFLGYKLQISREGHDEVVEAMLEAASVKTVTYRRGEPGAWTEVWTDRIDRAYMAELAKHEYTAGDPLPLPEHGTLASIVDGQAAVESAEWG